MALPWLQSLVLTIQSETGSFVNNWDTCGPQMRSLGMPNPFCFPQNSNLITDGTKGRADLRELQSDGAKALITPCLKRTLALTFWVR